MNINTTKLAVHGAWEVKRHISLPAMMHERDAQVVARHVEGIPGVRGTKTDTDRHRITVVYDITLLDYSHLLDALTEIGFPTRDTWWSRLKTSWCHYADVTGRENANAPPAPCCSNPKGINQPRK